MRNELMDQVNITKADTRDEIILNQSRQIDPEAPRIPLEEW